MFIVCVHRFVDSIWIVIWNSSPKNSASYRLSRLYSECTLSQRRKSCRPLRRSNRMQQSIVSTFVFVFVLSSSIVLRCCTGWFLSSPCFPRVSRIISGWISYAAAGFWDVWAEISRVSVKVGGADQIRTSHPAGSQYISRDAESLGDSLRAV